VLRVQAHPLDQFAVGEAVAVYVDAAHCTVFETPAARPVGPDKQGASP
jgi:hypothetical protein